MRGPGLRSPLVLRRQWRCPGCGNVRLLPASEVAVQCHCVPGPRWMTLIDAVPVKKAELSPVNYYVNYEDTLAATTSEEEAVCNEVSATPENKPAENRPAKNAELINNSLDDPSTPEANDAV